MNVDEQNYVLALEEKLARVTADLDAARGERDALVEKVRAIADEWSASEPDGSPSMVPAKWVADDFVAVLPSTGEQA